jgi:hypothetical protein
MFCYHLIDYTEKDILFRQLYVLDIYKYTSCLYAVNNYSSMLFSELISKLLVAQSDILQQSWPHHDGLLLPGGHLQLHLTQQDPRLAAVVQPAMFTL